MRDSIMGIFKSKIQPIARFFDVRFADIKVSKGSYFCHEDN